MQKTLTFTVDKKKYVSKPFDFETMRRINEKHNDETLKGPLSYCEDSVNYMFEGTEATQNVINALPVSVRAQLCTKLWGFYVEALTIKND